MISKEAQDAKDNAASTAAVASLLFILAEFVARQKGIDRQKMIEIFEGCSLPDGIPPDIFEKHHKMLIHILKQNTQQPK